MLDGHFPEAPPVTMAVGFVAAGTAGSETVVLGDYESFVLGRDVPSAPVHTFAPFWTEFRRTIELQTMPRSLVKITADPKEIEIKFDLGVRSSGGFRATLQGERIHPDLPISGVARRDIPRSSRGFVLELAADTHTAQLQIVASFGEAGIKTLVETHEAVTYLRENLLDMLWSRTGYSRVLAVALRAVSENPLRTSTRHIELIDAVRAGLDEEGLLERADDLIRHLFARVYVWIRSRDGEMAKVKVNVTPQKERWVGALRALGLERVALNPEDPAGTVETMLYRTPGTIDALVLLADQLDENGVVMFSDLERQLRPGAGR